MVSDAPATQTEQPPEVLAISHEDGFMVCDDDSTALIDLYIDSFGCDTDNPDEARAVVGRISGGKWDGHWLVVDLTKFVKMELT